MNTKELINQKVNVYFNLNSKLWSIKHKGKVVAHVSNLTMIPDKFHVSESGRQRVIARKQKEVHAWISGTIISFDNVDSICNPTNEISYNPYLYGYFYKTMNNTQYTNLSSPIYFNGKTRKVYHTN